MKRMEKATKIIAYLGGLILSLSLVILGTTSGWFQELYRIVVCYIFAWVMGLAWVVYWVTPLDDLKDKEIEEKLREEAVKKAVDEANRSVDG